MYAKHNELFCRQFERGYSYMMNILFYSRIPGINYNKTIKSAKIFAVFVVVLTVALYYLKGGLMSLLTCILLCGIELFEIHHVKSLHVIKDEHILSQAYKNGKFIKVVLHVLFTIYFIVMFGWQYGTILAVIMFIDTIYFLKRTN